jgi:ABC-2 type transport system ATP-binding protein
VLGKGGKTLVYRYEVGRGEGGEGGEGSDPAGDGAIAGLLQDLAAAGIMFTDLHTTQRSLEEIFVSLVSEREAPGTDERGNRAEAAGEGAR